jgi:hypothetical protein
VPPGQHALLIDVEGEAQWMSALVDLGGCMRIPPANTG